MPSDRLLATAERLVAYCRESKEALALAELYHPDAVSVEAAAASSGSREAQGLEAIRAKHAWWDENFDVHGTSVEGPFPHGDDRFALIFEIDVSEKASGSRSQMREVAVYTVDDAGRIVREEFFYRT